jgi:RNA polymerase sigma-70 factor (ECF subfamily)
VFDVQQVYEAHYRYVWRCLRSLGVREPQLDDALQDVFIVVQRRLAEFDGRVALSTWLYAIALRVARKARERARREADKSAEPLSTEEPPAPQADAEATLSSNQRLLLARRALEALDDDKREVFVLANIEQMSAPEIVEVLGIPLNTVYSRLRAARLAFASEVSRLSGRPRSAP